jgi:peptide chain release factor 1
VATESTVIERLIEQIEQRYGELTEQLADPVVLADRARYTEVARGHRELSTAHGLAQEYRRAESDAAGAEELLTAADGGLDATERRELQEMVSTSRAQMEELAERLRLAMVERDPNDSKNVIVEIRSGTGGDEAGLFAGDLYRMLTKYAERRGFKIEGLNHSPSPAGGFKDVTFAVKGDGAYSVFKY